ncbi:probable aquaporin TIP1-2 isoform X2 [Cimex lectularius]|uniref:Aquaporin n=1 Tax=Cimex lectularius TaxID=79782 RepID=A0A8I6THC5_CIMLE|nr:probable aquaporin TIP1-2 isoform X2 [Cimex lectularius]
MLRKLVKCKLLSEEANSKTKHFGCSCLHIVRYKSWDFFGGVLGFCFIIVSCAQFMQFTSGGHLNPALTVGMFLIGYIDLIRALILIVAQIIGSVLGFYILKMMSIRIFDKTENVWCCTIPSQESIIVLVLWEFVSTSFLIVSFFMLMLPNEKDNVDQPIKAEVNFTFTLLAAIYPIAEYSGISMNPARSLGPAAINDCWDHHWIYWFGPLLAAVVTSLIWNLFTEVKTEPSGGTVDPSNPANRETGKILTDVKTEPSVRTVDPSYSVNREHVKINWLGKKSVF